MYLSCLLYFRPLGAEYQCDCCRPREGLEALSRTLMTTRLAYNFIVTLDAIFGILYNEPLHVVVCIWYVQRALCDSYRIMDTHTIDAPSLDSFPSEGAVSVRMAFRSHSVVVLVYVHLLRRWSIRLNLRASNHLHLPKR